MRRQAFTALSRLGPTHATRRLNRGKVLVLMYHGFTETQAFHGIENHVGMHLFLADFRRQLDILRKQYDIVSLEDVVAHVNEGRALPAYPAVITMDDGYQSVYTLAFPILRGLGVPATLFVTTDFLSLRKPLWHDRVEHSVGHTRATNCRVVVGDARLDLQLASHSQKLDAVRQLRAALKKAPQDDVDAIVSTLEGELGVRLELDDHTPPQYQPLTWAEVSEMVRSDVVSVGSHTRSHAILSRCSAERLSDEVNGSRDDIEKHAGTRARWFCYPNGALGDYDERTRDALVAAHYDCGLTTVAGFNDSSADVMELRRFSAPSDPDEFMVTVSGLRLAMTNLRGRR